MKSKLLLPLLLIGAVLGTKKQAPPPEKHVSQEARKVLQQLRQVNASLKACKGLGDISIKRKSRRHQARMAWLAKVPDKIRLTLLGPGRRPLLTASADGEHLYYLNRSSKTRFFKKKKKQATLEDFFH